MLTKKNLLKSIITLLCCTLFSISQADDSPSILIKRLTMESANKISIAAVKECRKKGVQISVTVVDRNGLVQSVMRDTLAPPISLKISKMKAYTAANFTANTSSMSSRGNTPIGRINGLVMSSGGAIISVGGTMYGAVGVSGAPSGKTDEECAIAGIKAVTEDLEMAD